jgi:hypothetical protein
MMKREMTTEELWNEFRNELYPNGVPPALESDMKVAFHAGMMVAARFIIEATAKEWRPPSRSCRTPDSRG